MISLIKIKVLIGVEFKIVAALMKAIVAGQLPAAVLDIEKMGSTSLLLTHSL